MAQPSHTAIIVFLLLHRGKETALYQRHRGGLDHKGPREWTKHPSLSVCPEVIEQRWENYGSSPSVRIPAVLYLLQRRTLLIHDLSDAALTNLPTRVQIYSRLQTAKSQNSNSGATFYYIRWDRGRTRWFDLTASRSLNGSMTDLMCSR